MSIRFQELRFSKAGKAIAVIAIFGFVALGGSAQEEKGKIIEAKMGEKGEKAAAGPPAPGLLLEWAGEARVGNPYDELAKDNKHVVPVVYSRLAEKAPEKYKKIMGGSTYFAVFKNMGSLAKDGDTFGTGMKNFDKMFAGGDGFQFSPTFDTSANYLYLYQVVNGRGLDGRNFLKDPTPQKDRVSEKDVIKDFQEVSPKNEGIARWALSLAVRPREITSWGYFNGAGFVGQEQKNLNLFAEETKLPTTIKPVSFLPSMLEETPNPFYKNRAPAQSLGVMQPSFHVGSSTINLDKSAAYPGNDNAIKFAVSAAAAEKLVLPVFKGGERPLSSQLFMTYSEKAKKFQYDVSPSSVQIMYDSYNDLYRGEWGYPAGYFWDQDIIRSVLLVRFDEGHGLQKGQYSMVFGFTSNLPPRPERVRLDTEESMRESRPLEARPADLFSRQQVEAAEAMSSQILLAAAEGRGGLPGLMAFSREPGIVGAAGEIGGIGVQVGGVGVAGVGSLRTAAEIFVADNGIRAAADNESRQIPGPQSGGPGGGAGITGGFATGLGGVSSGGGGGGGIPALGAAGFPGFGGGFGGGGGIGGGTGTGTNQGTPTQTQGQAGAQEVVVDVFNSLLNQQQQQQRQQQQQQQSQHQHQQQHQHQHHEHHAVVPAPASFLLGLLGLPALLFFRRRKTADTETLATESAI